MSIVPRPRPVFMRGHTHRIRTGHGSLYVTVNTNSDSNVPFEVFVTTGKAGSCHYASAEAVGRLVSLCLRCGVAVEEVARQLRGISCCPHWDDGVQVKSPADAVSVVLSRYTDDARNPSDAREE